MGDFDVIDVGDKSVDFFLDFLRKFGCCNLYTPVIKHSNGKSPFSIGNTSSKGSFSIAMLDYQRVIHGKAERSMEKNPWLSRQNSRSLMVVENRPSNTPQKEAGLSPKHRVFMGFCC